MFEAFKFKRGDRVCHVTNPHVEFVVTQRSAIEMPNDAVVRVYHAERLCDGEIEAIKAIEDVLQPAEGV